MNFLKLNRLAVICIFLIISGCGSFSVYNTEKYNQKSQWFLLDDTNVLAGEFVLCAEILAKKIELDYKATLMCSSVKKEMKLVKKGLLNKCYLLQPIEYYYQCV